MYTEVLVFATFVLGSLENTEQKLRFSTLTNLEPDQNWFTTVLVTSLRDCGDVCDTVSSCVFVNYKSRGQVCGLVHYTGTSNINIKEDRVVGYVSRRSLTYNMFQTSRLAALCSNCNKSQSCLVEPDTGQCERFACGNPPTTGAISIKGSINTVGGRFMYRCYNHSEGTYYTRLFQCSENDLPAGWDVCGYEDYGTYKLKIVKRTMNMTQASRRCAKEGTSILTILTKNKLDFVQGISQHLPKRFWVGLVRVDKTDTLWRTSDGGEHVIDTSLWNDYTRKEKVNADCARVFRGDEWKITNVYCGKKYYYVCEISKSGFIVSQH